MTEQEVILSRDLSISASVASPEATSAKFVFVILVNYQPPAVCGGGIKVLAKTGAARTVKVDE